MKYYDELDDKGWALMSGLVSLRFVIYWENICDVREHTTENSWKREGEPVWVEGSTSASSPPPTDKRQSSTKPKCYTLILCCQEHLGLHAQLYIKLSFCLFYTQVPLYTDSICTGQE